MSLPIYNPVQTANEHASGAGWAFARLPEELRAHCKDAHSADLFARLHRPWTWNSERPNVSNRITSVLTNNDGLALPRIVEHHLSADGARKLVLEFTSGDRVELVHMPRAVQSGRVTLCVSSQVGCAMGCTFCATARMGLMRQLRAGEIVGQILVALHAFGPRHPGELSLVFMGMGEPLHNLANVARAVRILCHPAGLGLSPRRITISTSGLVPQIIELGKSVPRPLLAVSLNATSDAQRRDLMPIGRRYGIAQLKQALESYPLRPRERITLEYVLLAGINDSLDDARRLAEFGEHFPHHINLIPFNEHPHSDFRAPSESALDNFAQALLAHRPRIVTVRRSRGRDVGAACGQLIHEPARAP